MIWALVHLVQHWFGFRNGEGNNPEYLFWSGIFGDVAIFAAAFVFIRHKNCHVRGCWRLQWKDHEGHALCRKHHPHDPPKASDFA